MRKLVTEPVSDGNVAKAVEHIRGRDKREENTGVIKRRIYGNLLWGIPSRPAALGLTKERLQELQKEVIREHPDLLLHKVVNAQREEG